MPNPRPLTPAQRAVLACLKHAAAVGHGCCDVEEAAFLSRQRAAARILAALERRGLVLRDERGHWRPTASPDPRARVVDLQAVRAARRRAVAPAAPAGPEAA